MPRVTIPISGGRQVDRAPEVNNQRAINWEASLEGSGAKSALTMIPTVGLTRVETFGNGPCRSEIIEFKGAAYYVSGGELLKMTAAESVSSVGALNTSSGRCYIAAGRDYLMVVDGGDGYTWDDSTFAAISDVHFPSDPTYCAYVNGYFVSLNSGSDEWIISSPEDPTAWDALEFASAEASPDDAVAVVATYRDVYIIGTKTTQVYYFSENPDFPFNLYANGVLEFGTPAAASVTRTGGNIFMLGQEQNGGLTVLRVNGFQAERIADPDIAETLANMTTVSDAFGFSYTEADKTYYVLTFPTEDITLVYHVEQRMWHERQSGDLGRWRVLGYGRFNNKHYCGDYDNAKIYTLDRTVYTEDGATVRRVRRFAALHRDRLQFEVNEIEIEFKGGVGLLTGQGSDPKVMLRYSVDGGRTWSSTRTRELPELGEYDSTAIWHRFGQCRDFRAEIVVSDPIEAIMIAGYMETEVLAA